MKKELLTQRSKFKGLNNKKINWEGDETIKTQCPIPSEFFDKVKKLNEAYQKSMNLISQTLEKINKGSLVDDSSEGIAKLMWAIPDNNIIPFEKSQLLFLLDAENIDDYFCEFYLKDNEFMVRKIMNYIETMLKEIVREDSWLNTFSNAKQLYHSEHYTDSITLMLPLIEASANRYNSKTVAHTEKIPNKNKLINSIKSTAKQFKPEKRFTILLTVNTYNHIWSRGESATYHLNRNIILHGASKYTETKVDAIKILLLLASFLSIQNYRE